MVKRDLQASCSIIFLYSFFYVKKKINETIVLGFATVRVSVKTVFFLMLVKYYRISCPYLNLIFAQDILYDRFIKAHSKFLQF